MLFCLVKVFDQECHAQKFRKGTLFARKLSHFRELEEGSRRDPTEGTLWHHQPDQIIMEINGMRLDGLVGPVRMASNDALDLNVFCMTAFHDEDVEYPIDLTVLQDRVIQPQGYLKFGQFAVLVIDVGKFLERVDKAARTRGYRFGGNLVKYYDPGTFNGRFDDPAHRKPNQFADEREYRLVFQTDAEGPLELEIGDIHDITISMKSSEITKNTRVAGKD